jgi:hypothetical protein
MLDHQLDVIRMFIQHLLDERLEPRTVRSLIVAENHDRDRSIRRAFEGPA